MPPKKAAKKSTTSSAAKSAKAAVAREAKKAECLRYIAEHDPLLDPAPTHPIPLSSLFHERLLHKTFTLTKQQQQRQPHAPQGPQPYDWSVFQQVLAARNASSPRWFLQLREEDLLLGPDGMDGVTVDCFVIVEATEPTLSPAEYIVKQHWPYSNIEDNAPERILSIKDTQKMVWRRVVKDDGSDINVYFLCSKEEQPAAAPAPAPSFGFGTSSAAPVTAPAPAPSFGFGASSAAPVTATAAAPAVNFGFGFGTAAPTATTAAPSFGFGTSAPPSDPHATSTTTAAPASFGFGQSTTTTSSTAAPVPSFGFGAAATTATTATGPSKDDNPLLQAQPLKPSELLFALWSKKKIREMEKDIHGGSRIVREDYPLPPFATLLQQGAGKVEGVDAAALAKLPTTINLVLQNDRKDDVAKAVKRLVLTKLFAKVDADMQDIDQWMENCPLYEEQLVTALQDFRAKHVEALAEDSSLFQFLYAACREGMEAELKRIVAIREAAAAFELQQLQRIHKELDAHYLAEKSSFRLLKYYAKNDVLPFRPFGKISGICEKGESVDVCEPPAFVNINPFTGLPM